MLALKINQVGVFMNHLLAGNVFDSFSLAEASITTFSHFTIDGTLQKDFFDTDTSKSLNENNIVYASWEKIRPYCYSIIKGKLPPLQFRIVFHLSPERLPPVMGTAPDALKKERVQALFLNIQFRNKELLCTTGISAQGFSLSKEAEHAWDEMVLRFFKNCHFDFESL